MGFVRFGLSCLFVGLAGGAAVAQQPRIQEARRECWAAVGVYGDPAQSRYSYKFRDQVTECVRGKMAASPQGKTRR